MAPIRGPPSLRAEFDRQAALYDVTAPRSMPGYSELHRMLCRGVPFLPTRAFRVLELGVGTGTLTSLILSSFPHAEVVGIDLSPKMIGRARTKLRAYRGRIDLIAAPIEEFPEGRFDVVVSALAIHHLTHSEKWRLFRRIHRTLSPGGYFGDGDDHLPEDPLFDSRYAQIASTAFVGPRGGGGRPSLPIAWHEHEKFDHPCTLEAEVAQLGRAGFPHVGVPWQFFAQAVVWAYK
jgi:ubiquinone/menaquinone biosynthesis C-methylase UbiE